jgi:tripartite-type tricarboxylate transporter receptor subunit TctC
MRDRTVCRFVVGIFVASLLLFSSFENVCAKDSEYPTKPINFYIAHSPGGTTDLACRAFINAASKHLGQPMVAINRPGAGGCLTGAAVMAAKPDGYTLCNTTPSNMFTSPYSDVSPYKDLSQFTQLVNFGNYIYPLMVRDDSPFKTWKDFIDWAKNNPRAAKIGTIGAKMVTSHGLILGQIENRENAEFTYITLGGSADILTALLGGHITLFSSTVDASVVPYVKTGKVRILTYMSAIKMPGYEKIPSTKELYGFEIPNLLGVIGPKGLPDDVLQKLDSAFAKAVKDPEFIGVMEKMYTPVVYKGREEVTPFVNKTFKDTGEIMKMFKAEEAKKKK